ncbi:MAG TPA: NAD(P)/FAD-dependent oxidoreductase [Dehalococcoidia bacterium]|nr:NAD(P)/FAD-dependent oxidoreductase [Dehalococcoidia bacterium]
MTESKYDAIVVGARCAGSPLAMLLARKGYRILLVDKASFPSDTVSTHIVHTPGIAALKRWGLFERLAATDCPPIDTYAFNFGPFTLEGSPATAEAEASYAPRRTVIDKLLLDAAAEAGAEVRERFTVDELIFEEGNVAGIRGHAYGGGSVTERARVVVGADGLRSLVAEAVNPEQYNAKPPLLVGYYSYWSGVPMRGRMETYVRPYRGYAAWPTNDGLTLVIAGWPYAEFVANRHDIEGNFWKALDLVPEFAERARAGRREERFRGMFVPNFFRKPFGPGWALVGDAAYNKDPITGQGMQDAFRDAELLAQALDESFTGSRHFYAAMSDYQAARDRHVMAMYEFTTQLATLEPPPEEMQKVLASVTRSQEAMDGFVRMAAGATSPAEFFSEENLGRIMAAADPTAG